MRNIIKHGFILAAGALLAFLTTGCATIRSQQLPYLIRENLDNARRHLAQKNNEEAAQIYQAVLLADPLNAEARTGLDGIPSYDAKIMKPTVLGTNYCRRPKRDVSRRLRLAMYPLNRVLDALDVFSFHVGLEGGVLADAHLTHAMQLQAGGSGGMQLGWWQGRNLAAGSAYTSGFALGPFNCENEGFTRAGTRGAAAKNFSLVNMGRPTDFVYQHYRDYWGIGARVTAAIVGFEAEFHPLELADAMAGFFFVDFLRDDIGETRNLKLNDAERDAIDELINTVPAPVLRKRLAGRKSVVFEPAPAGAPAPGETIAPPRSPPPPRPRPRLTLLHLRRNSHRQNKNAPSYLHLPSRRARR